MLSFSFLKSAAEIREQKKKEVNDLVASITRNIKILITLTTRHAGPESPFSSQIEPTKLRISKHMIRFTRLVEANRALKKRDTEFSDFLETQYAETSKSVMLLIEELGKKNFSKTINALKTVKFIGFDDYLDELRERPILPHSLERDTVDLDMPSLVSEHSVSDSDDSRASSPSSTVSFVHSTSTVGHTRTKTFDLSTFIPKLDERKELPKKPKTHRKERSVLLDMWKIMVDTPPSTQYAKAPAIDYPVLSPDFVKKDKIVDKQLQKKKKLMILTEQLLAEKKLFNETDSATVRKQCLMSITDLKKKLQKKIKKYENEKIFSTRMEPGELRGTYEQVIVDPYWKYAVNALKEEQKFFLPVTKATVGTTHKQVADIMQKKSGNNLSLPVAKADDEDFASLLFTGARDPKFQTASGTAPTVFAPALTLPLSPFSSGTDEATETESPLPVEARSPFSEPEVTNPTSPSVSQIGSFRRPSIVTGLPGPTGQQPDTATSEPAEAEVQSPTKANTVIVLGNRT